MWIFEFSMVADWSSRLATLAQMAEPERWRFNFLPSREQNPILDNYVKYTFARAYEQSKIVQTDQLACFNTGLLTPAKEEIFGIFTVSNKYDPAVPVGPANKKWFLKNWLRSGDRTLTEFMEMPQLVSFWTDSRDLIFDPALQVQLNLDHIIRDNLDRFPVSLGGKVGEDGVPQDWDADGVESEDEPPEALQQASEIPLATRNALEGAMQHSIRLAQRSYRMAVPQFHQDKMQLLLPLYLKDARQPNLALTLERSGEWYRAATVLYVDWAYCHARLLARPNSEWLGGLKSDTLETIRVTPAQINDAT